MPKSSRALKSIRSFSVLLPAIIFLSDPPALAGDLIPPTVFTTTPGGVNISDGVYTETNVDLSVGTLNLERFHLGVAQVPNLPIRRDPNDPFFGEHVSHNFDIYVASNYTPQNEYYPAMYKPIVHFGLSASGTYQRAFGSTDLTVRPNSHEALKGTLALINGNYVYTDQDGVIYTFDKNIPAEGANAPSQRVASISYPSGRVLMFSYSGSKLKQVRDNHGYALVFDYGSNGNVSSACGFNLSQTYVTSSTSCAGAALKTAYAYTGDLLISVTDVNGHTTGYTYSTRELCITPPGASKCKIKNIYNSYDQVIRQEMADGSVWTLQLGPPIRRDPEIYPESESYTGVTDPVGKETQYVFTATTLNKIIDPEGREANYVFEGGVDFHDPAPLPNQGSMLREVASHEGNKYVVSNNGPYLKVSEERWEAKPGSGIPAAVVTYGYASCASLPKAQCTKPIWKKDERGNQTDYTYAIWGGLLTEMKPAPTSGAARPLTVNTYVQKYAYVKNSAGALVPAATPIWVQATATQCQAVAGASPAPVCDSGAVQTVTSYEYGGDGTANTLLLRGKVVTADGVSLRTCYGYDAMGNRISETEPRAGLTSCP